MANRTGIVSEFVLFLREKKTYWMVPILIVLGLFGIFIALGSTGAAPFIYALF